MKVELFESKDLGFVFLRTSGRFRSGDLVRIQSELALQPLIQSGLDVLNDARTVDFSVDREDVIAAGRMLQADQQLRPKNKVAIVVRDQLAIGILRMYFSFRRLDGESSVHLSISDALAWLKKPASLEEDLNGLNQLPPAIILKA